MLQLAGNKQDHHHHEVNDHDHHDDKPSTDGTVDWIGWDWVWISGWGQNQNTTMDIDNLELYG